MHFRCSSCLSATALDRVEPVRESEKLVCGDCGESFTVKPTEPLGATLGDHYRRTSRVSTEHQIDMPTAYSVVLGLISVGQLGLLRGASEDGPGEAGASAAEATEAEQELEIDPAFSAAIAAGCLTKQEAFRRGDRRAYAVGLARRHGIKIDLAYLHNSNFDETFRISAGYTF